jgi:hypothetical protein
MSRIARRPVPWSCLTAVTTAPTGLLLGLIVDRAAHHARDFRVAVDEVEREAHLGADELWIGDEDVDRARRRRRVELFAVDALRLRAIVVRDVDVGRRQVHP